MENGVRRWFVDISKWDPSQDRFSFLVSLLPDRERTGITRFKKFDDRKRALVCRLLQYSLVHEVLEIPFDKIVINRTIEGKPYLENEHKRYLNFNFNASHQGSYVGIASEPECLVGLDIVSVVIPQQETALDFIKNFSSYFTTVEWNTIMNAHSSDKILDAFFRYWSLKEAFVKALGAGLGYGLHRLEFHHNNWTNISVHIDGVKSTDWRFWILELDEKHLACVAKGLPKGADMSYNRALEQDFKNEGFILCSVEELIQTSHAEKSCSC